MTSVRISIAGAALALAGCAGGGEQAATLPPSTAPAPQVATRAGMVLVPAGEFVMGSQPSDNWAESDEQPARVVNVPAFYIDELEVTNLQFRRFLDATGWQLPPEWHERVFIEDAEFLPVTGVSWWDATAYARWAGKRLPTEVEWEKAARGTDARRFPWGNDFVADNANNDRYVLPAGSKASGASPYGAFDMAGNVAEWTSSVYAPYPKIEAVLPSDFGGTSAQSAGVGAPSALPSPAPPEPATAAAAATTASGAPATAPTADGDVDGPDPRRLYFSAAELEDRRQRVYRGGSFNSYARFLRCANRQPESPGSRWENVGFRCALDAPGETKP